MTRRDFIRRAGRASAGIALSAYSALPHVSAASSRKPRRPNILFAIADDWSWPHASIHGDKVVNTPNFDRVAREGVLFANSFCAAPTCTASRGGVLTGQAIHRLEAGGNLHSVMPARFRVYPDVLEEAGYFVGATGKGWGPGDFAAGGWKRNPAGPKFEGFRDFIARAPADKPFCFWYGSLNPHRPYEEGSGARSGMKAKDVVVPPFLPDTPEVRNDLLDYYYEVQLFDRQVGELLDEVEDSGRAENTLVVVTSDNGMPFPRAKANLYEAGTHMPLAVRWPARVKAGRRIEALVSHTDFAPTFLEAAGIDPLPDMTGRSFLDLLLGAGSEAGEAVFTERERHANVRKGDLSYPCRAVRTKDFLYIRNFEPDRWPAGDPTMYQAVGKYGDIDGSPTKTLLLDNQEDRKISGFFHLACDKRPEEELFDLRKDPWTVSNVAAKPEYADTCRKLRKVLDDWMAETADPRSANPHDDRWDRYEYYGAKKK